MAYVPFAVACAVLFYLQALAVDVTAVAPDLGPLLAVHLGLFARRERVAGAVGLLGLLRGAVGAEPIGAVVLTHLALAYLVLTLRDVLFADRVVTQWVVAFLGGAVFLVLRLVIGLVVPLGGEEGAGGLARLAVSTLLATAIAPLLFALLRTLRVGP